MSDEWSESSFRSSQRMIQPRTSRSDCTATLPALLLAALLMPLGILICLSTLGTIAAALALALLRADAHADAWARRHAPLVGASLGSWLVLERWQLGTSDVLTACCGAVPSPYSYAPDADDEFALSAALADSGNRHVIDEFRAARVSLADFRRMAAAGLNAVRVPVPYWIVLPDAATPYHSGRGMGLLDDVVKWADECGMHLLLELHAAPGGQGPTMTSGHAANDWNATWFDVGKAVTVIERIASRFASSDAVIGISPLNEPTLPSSLLVEYYLIAHRAMRRAGMRADRVAFVVQLYGLDAIFTLAWARLNFEPDISCLLYDLHLYFGVLTPPLPRWLDRLATPDFVVGPLVAVQAMLLDLCGRPALVGEWSLRTPYVGKLGEAFATLGGATRDAFLRRFGQHQATLYTGSGRLGGFFWSWGCVSAGEEDFWSLPVVQSRGWLAGTAWAGLSANSSGSSASFCTPTGGAESGANISVG